MSQKRVKSFDLFLDLLYAFTIRVVGILAIPYLLYMSIRYKKYRQGWRQKLFGDVPELPGVENGKKRIWFHAVSVGEVNLIKPIVKEIRARGLNYEFVVSSTSDTGYQLAQKLFGDQTLVFHCPLDLKRAVTRVLQRVKPDVLTLVELELWPTIIKTVCNAGTPVAIVNGRVSDQSFKRYRLVRWALAPTFRRIALIAAQDERAEKYFKELSPCPERVVTTGSLKFDGVETNRENAATQRARKLVGIEESDVVFLAGSTQEGEEAAALETYCRLREEFPELKLILVPRHRERFEDVARMLDESGVPWVRRSQLDAESPQQNDGSERWRVILIDAIGELGAWWGLAQIAFVGGSWGSRGGQNMLEPSGYGAAVSFGPNTQNFRAIVEALLQARAAVVVSDTDEMAAFVRRCLVEPQYRQTLGDAARELTLRNAGAARKTVEELAKLIEK